MRIDHVQLAIPPGSEEQCREFYISRLGFVEEPKPEVLAQRGGLWLRRGELRLHLGVDPDFHAASKAHPGIRVNDIDSLAEEYHAAGVALDWDDSLPGHRRFYLADCVGNRLEFLSPTSQLETGVPTSLSRRKDRGSTDRIALNRFLDSQRVCTLSTVSDGQPWAVPTLYARRGDQLLVHGSSGAGALRHLAAGAPVVITVMAMDSLVIARNARNHSADYRSATIRGQLHQLTGTESAEALSDLTDTLIPGRMAELPDLTDRDLAGTQILSLTISETNWLYKQRSHGFTEPDDAPAHPPQVWAGTVPMTATFGEPVPAPGNNPGLPLPDSVTHLVDDGDPTRELRDLEPVFHQRRHIHDPASFDAAVPDDFWEVGASGYVYDRATVRDTVLDRLSEPTDQADRENWTITEFTVRRIAPTTYLATYQLDQNGRHTRRATIWTRDSHHRWQVRYHQGTLTGPQKSTTDPTDA